jgi:transcriptional regulator with XRE-family HTH domain
MSEIHERFGVMLKAQRKEKGLTINQVAEVAGYSIPYISDIENGKAEGSGKALCAIANALGMRLTLVDTDTGAEADGRDIPAHIGYTLHKIAVSLAHLWWWTLRIECNRWPKKAEYYAYGNAREVNSSELTDRKKRIKVTIEVVNEV